MTTENRNQEQAQPARLTRRQFMGAAVATTGATLAPGVMLIGLAQAKPDDQAVSGKVRWGMLVDTTKCATGCNDCVTACNTEHGLSGKTGPQDSQWIRKVQLKEIATGKQHSLPMMCQHCEHPPCVDVCPTGASFRRADGIVLVDRHTCIGCRYCMMACPYKARSLVHETLTEQLPDVPRGKGCVESCTLCVHKVDAGDGSTACVDACNAAGHAALVFGDLNDPNSEVSQRIAAVSTKQVRADLGLNTGVLYHGI
jgi:molybdopterin-containing oxidoreductase family iron-sulfur binding subunit